MSEALAVANQTATTRLNPVQSSYLDVLRGCAAQIVLLQHAFGNCLPSSGIDQYGLGAFGVMSFFLLSGFLITDSVRTSVLRGHFTFRSFFINRFRRIYTAFVPALLLVAALDWYSWQSPVYDFPQDYNVHTAISNLFMLQDYPVFQILRRLHVHDQPWFVSSFGSARQLWTISIEWWIYMLVGLVTAMALNKGRASWLLWISVAIVAIEPAYNFIGGPGDCLTLVWFVGGAAALLYRRAMAGVRPLRLAPWRLAVAWGALLMLAILRVLYTHGRLYDAVFSILLAGLVFFIPLVGLSTVRGVGTLRRLRLDRLSFHSYSLYLTHSSVIIFLASRYPTLVAGWRGLAVIIVVTNLFALLFAYIFEHHATNWLKRMSLPRFAPNGRRALS